MKKVLSAAMAAVMVVSMRFVQQTGRDHSGAGRVHGEDGGDDGSRDEGGCINRRSDNH